MVVAVVVAVMEIAIIVVAVDEAINKHKKIIQKL